MIENRDFFPCASESNALFAFFTVDNSIYVMKEVAFEDRNTLEAAL